MRLRCMDCRLFYDRFGLDVVLPRGQWLLVNPAEHGVLCARCIVRRAAKIPGATVVHAVIDFVPGTMRPERDAASSTRTRRKVSCCTGLAIVGNKGRRG